MLTVACVLRSGGIYDATWVARLKAGVARHLPHFQHRFVCLSDVDVPCERIPLVHGWPGWWAKVELFRLPGPVLYFDLDTAIVGSLSEIASQTASGMGFTILQDFYRATGFGSGVMAWDDRFDALRLYAAFASDADGWMQTCQGGGDQQFIERQGLNTFRRWQDDWPGQVVSYKYHCCGGRSPITGQMMPGGIPANARVVCLHGRPKFADMPAQDPVRCAWEMAA